jgi:hypothetical protein
MFGPRLILLAPRAEAGSVAACTRAQSNDTANKQQCKKKKTNNNRIEINAASNKKAFCLSRLPLLCPVWNQST